MPTISVIVPVYNLEEEVPKCILSILLQKFSDFEIIAIDDGSSDRSPKILDELAKKYKEQIRVFHTKNRGLSAARNFGLTKARGKYITFVDSDDYVDPEYLSQLYQAITDDEADIAVSGYTEFNGEKMHDFVPKKKILSGRAAAERLLRGQENLEVVSWNKLYKKSVFKGIKFPIGKNHEDNYTTYKLYKAAEKVSYVPLPLYNYVRREKSITVKEKTITRLNAKLAAAREAKKYFKKDNELFAAAEFAEVLAYFQFIDFSIKQEITKSNFKKYREKVLKTKVKLDKKRNFYVKLLRPFNGFLYKAFRKLVK
jgi:glycosyltransferase involved in cell wall biosynthesis